MVLTLLRLARFLGLILCVILGLGLAASHALLCRLRLAHPHHIHGFARCWFRSVLRVANIRPHLDAPGLERRGLVVANHTTWLDIPVLGALLPTYFLSKAEVRDMPLVGWLAERGGTLFIHRGRHELEEVRDRMQRRLGDGHFLTFFPEGTTGGGRLRPFHPRLFAAAIETGVPVIPVAIRYSDDPDRPRIPFEEESFVANIWRILGVWRTDVTVRVLPALESAGMPRRALADQAREVIERSLNPAPEATPRGRPAPAPESRP